jgi:hypothetical protein
VILSAGLKRLVEFDSPLYGRIGAVNVKYDAFGKIAGNSEVVYLDTCRVYMVFSLDVEPSINRDTIGLRPRISVKGDPFVFVTGGFGDPRVKRRYSEKVVEDYWPKGWSVRSSRDTRPTC